MEEDKKTQEVEHEPGNENGNIKGTVSHTQKGLGETMEKDPLLSELLQKLKDYGIKNPDINIVKTILNNLEIILKDEGKQWKDVDDMDIKLAMIMGKTYKNGLKYIEWLQNMNLTIMYRLFEIIETFKIKFSHFIEFKIMYDEIRSDLESKLELLQGKGLTPKTYDELKNLNNMNMSWLQEYIKNSTSVDFVDLELEYEKRPLYDESQFYNELESSGELYRLYRKEDISWLREPQRNLIDAYADKITKTCKKLTGNDLMKKEIFENTILRGIQFALYYQEKTGIINHILQGIIDLGINDVSSKFDSWKVQLCLRAAFYYGITFIYRRDGLPVDLLKNFA